MKKSSLTLLSLFVLSVSQLAFADTQLFDTSTATRTIAADGGDRGGDLSTASDVLDRQRSRKKKEAAKKAAAKKAQDDADAAAAAATAAAAQKNAQTPKQKAQSQNGAKGSSNQLTPKYINPPTYQSDQAGTISAPAASLKTAKKPFPVSVRFRDYTALNSTGFENAGSGGGGSEAYAWDRLNVDYHFNDNISLGVLGQYYHTWFGDPNRPQLSNTAGLTQSYSSYVGNTGLILANSKLADLGNGFVLDNLLRYDLPTSEFSQAAGSPGEGWASLGLSRSVGIVDLKLTGMIRYYFQTRDTSNIVDLKTNLREQNDMVRFYYYTDVGVNITKKFSFNFEGGFINEIFHDGDLPAPGVADPYQVGAKHDYFILNPEIDYAFNDHFGLAIGIWEQPDMRGLNGNYVPFSSDPQNDNEDYILTTIKF